MFWASVYEKLFGRQAERGDVATAFAGGAAVAGLAYVTDYTLEKRRPRAIASAANPRRLH